MRCDKKTHNWKKRNLNPNVKFLHISTRGRSGRLQSTKKHFCRKLRRKLSPQGLRSIPSESASHFFCLAALLPTNSFLLVSLSLSTFSSVLFRAQAESGLRHNINFRGSSSSRWSDHSVEGKTKGQLHFEMVGHANGTIVAKCHGSWHARNREQMRSLFWQPTAFLRIWDQSFPTVGHVLATLITIIARLQWAI